MAGVTIDPETGLPVFDPATDPSTTGTTLTTNPMRGFGAAGATPMRGPNPKPPFGFGASSAQPMRGPAPNFPYPDPNSLNPVSAAQGPGAPTNSWFQRPSGQTGNGAPALGDVDSPGGGYGGGARSGPLQYGPGRSPSGWSGPDSGGIGSDANFPTGPIFNGATPNEVTRSNAYGGDSAGNPSSGGGGLLDWLRNLGSGPAVGPNGALPMGSGMSPAMAPAPDPSQRSPGSDANSPLAGGAGPSWFPGGNNPMPWQGGGAPAAAGGRAPRSVNMGHGAPGVVAPHPLVQAAQAHAAAQAASGQQPNSPFTMVMRPNASAQNGNAYPGSMNTGPRGGGGTPLATALDLSGWRPQAAPPPQAAPAPRARVQGPLAKTALKRPAIAATPGVGAPATGGPGPDDPEIIARQRQRMPRTPADYGDQSWLYGTQPMM